jgi:NTE family protein
MTETAKAAPAAKAPKKVNLALQGGGSHGAYTWGVLEVFLEREDLEIVGISGASAGSMNAVVMAAGLLAGGREGARRNLQRFWLSVSGEGEFSAAERSVVDAWVGAWSAFFTPNAWLDLVSKVASPYALNPLNVNPLRDDLLKVVDFEALRHGPGPKLFISATNVHTGQGEIFRRDILTADHVMASACLPQLFQSVEIGGVPYWDGGFSGNPPLWPLFYETDCNDTIIVEIDPIERRETPRTAEAISNRMNEITFNASLLAEMRAANFVARLIDSGALKGKAYRRERLHRVGGAGKLEEFGAASKLDSSWTFLTTLRDLGRASATEWLAANYHAIGHHSTLDVHKTLRKPGVAPPVPAD